MVSATLQRSNFDNTPFRDRLLSLPFASAGRSSSSQPRVAGQAASVPKLFKLVLVQSVIVAQLVEDRDPNLTLKFWFINLAAPVSRQGQNTFAKNIDRVGKLA